MSDQTDGSSIAAQSAQSIETPVKPTLWTRLFPKTETDEPWDSEGPAPQVGSLLNLRDMRVEDVAVPRTDIVAVDRTLKLEELVETFRTSGYSRLPIYEDNLDNPIGLIHLKDLALEHGFNGKTGRFNLKKLVRPLLFAPPSMPIGVLLQKMQTDRKHMAMVIDEYGGVDGLVTIEDLIEQVVGEISDEHDVEEDVLWVEESPGVYLCQARMPYEDFTNLIGTDILPEVEMEDVDTLGGVIFMLMGRVPARREILSLGDGLEVQVMDADPRRIKRVRVRTSDAPT